MHSRFLTTKFIQLDTKLCKACWKCTENCYAEIIGKVDFFFHKHARFCKTEGCTGCLKCINACEYGALTPLIQLKRRIQAYEQD